MKYLQLKIICSSFFIILTGSINLSSQTTENKPQTQVYQETQQQINRQQNRDDIRRANNNIDNRGPLISRRRGKSEDQKELERLFAELTTVNRADITRYRNFLDGKNTGIFRLMPNYNCRSSKIVDVNDKCFNTIKETTAFSFRHKYYSNYPYHDLIYRDGYFRTNGFLNTGAMVSLGVVPIENVSPDHPGIGFLSDLKFGETKETILKQIREFKNGITENNFYYTDRLPAKLDQTYALRVAAHRISGDKIHLLYQIDRRPLNEKQKSLIENLNLTYFRQRNYGKRFDTIVIFRPVRLDDDGGITIVWKRLSKQKSVKLPLKKIENVLDFMPFYEVIE